jgi:hypothetical protein
MRTLNLLSLAALLACAETKAEEGREPEPTVEVSGKDAKRSQARSAVTPVAEVRAKPAPKEERLYAKDPVMAKGGKQIELSGEQRTVFADVVVHASNLPGNYKSWISVESYGFDDNKLYLINMSTKPDEGTMRHFSTARLEYKGYHESSSSNTDGWTLFQVLGSPEAAYVLELHWTRSYSSEHEETFMDRADFAKVGFSGPAWEKAEAEAWSGQYILRVWSKTGEGLKDVTATVLPVGFKIKRETDGASEKRIARDYSLSASHNTLQIGNEKYSWDGSRFSREK